MSLAIRKETGTSEILLLVTSDAGSPDPETGTGTEQAANATKNTKLIKILTLSIIAPYDYRFLITKRFVSTCCFLNRDMNARNG
jgi:hypothetical protein